MSPNLTPARRHALELVGRIGHARVGQGTYECTDDDPIITPAAEGWLLAQGYVERSGEGEKRVDLTEAGLKAFTELPAKDGADDPGDEPVESLTDRDEPVRPEVVGVPTSSDGPQVVPVGRVPAYEGETPSGLDTIFGGKVGSIRHLRLAERAVVLAVVESKQAGHKNTARDGIRAVQSISTLEAWELDGPAAERLLNNVREAWGGLHDVDPLPFKVAGDKQLVDALGLGEHAAVVVVFADGARAVHPDDFPKGSLRPIIGERLDVPGGVPDMIVIELIDHATGTVLAVWDDEDAVPDEQVDGAGDEEG